MYQSITLQDKQTNKKTQPEKCGHDLKADEAGQTKTMDKINGYHQFFFLKKGLFIFIGKSGI